MKMTTNIKDFAKVANMPVKDFSELVNKDLFGAFEKVIEGSKKGGDSTTALAEIIKDLGVDGAGASEVFLKLGENVEHGSGELLVWKRASVEDGEHPERPAVQAE